MKVHRDPRTVHPPLGAYTHQAEITGSPRWLVLSGQIGVGGLDRGLAVRRPGQLRLGPGQDHERLLRRTEPRPSTVVTRNNRSTSSAITNSDSALQDSNDEPTYAITQARKNKRKCLAPGLPKCISLP